MTKSKSHYEVLGVLKTSSQDDIKKAYRKLVLVHHPDKGGDEEQFKIICESYEILSDPNKRMYYDANPFMNSASNPGFSSTASPSDFFYNLFSGGSPGFAQPFRQNKTNQANRQHKKTPNITHKCLLTLEDFYAGKNCKLAISRKIQCKECSGLGGRGKTNVNCIGCLGSGCRETQKGGMTVKTTCIQCRGKGTKMIFDRVCNTCKTIGTVSERIVVEAYFKPGSSVGDKVVLKNMSDAIEGKSPGDIIVVAAEKSHRIFKRKGNTLKCSIDINIKQSLCGFSAEISQLDGRILNVSRDEVTPHGHKIIIDKEGIPMNVGNMEVTINVIFPTKVPPSSAKRLMQCLDELV